MDFSKFEILGITLFLKFKILAESKNSRLQQLLLLQLLFTTSIVTTTTITFLQVFAF